MPRGISYGFECGWDASGPLRMKNPSVRNKPPISRDCDDMWFAHPIHLWRLVGCRGAVRLGGVQKEPSLKGGLSNVGGGIHPQGERVPQDSEVGSCPSVLGVRAIRGMGG